MSLSEQLIERRLLSSEEMERVTKLQQEQQAPLTRLIVELGYLSNVEDEKRLGAAEFQSGIAGAVTEAVGAFRDYLEQGAQAPTP